MGAESDIHDSNFDLLLVIRGKILLIFPKSFKTSVVQNFPFFAK